MPLFPVLVNSYALLVSSGTQEELSKDRNIEPLLLSCWVICEYPYDWKGYFLVHHRSSQSSREGASRKGEQDGQCRAGLRSKNICLLLVICEVCL